MRRGGIWLPSVRPLFLRLLPFPVLISFFLLRDDIEPGPLFSEPISPSQLQRLFIVDRLMFSFSSLYFYFISNRHSMISSGNSLFASPVAPGIA